MNDDLRFSKTPPSAADIKLCHATSTEKGKEYDPICAYESHREER